MLKPREERRKVLVRARMRCGGSWSDACIVNIASRGLGLQSASPPERGQYVEICRGRHVIVARVIWNKGHRFGVQARGTLPIQAIVHQPDHAAAAAPAEERRAAPRVPRARHEKNRQRGRRLEYAFVTFAGLCFVVSLVAMVQEAFTDPLAVISTALAKQ